MSAAQNERRSFFRHPSSAPLQVFPEKTAVSMPMSDISEGGLSFKSNVFLDKGAVLTIRIPHVTPPFEASCVVCWRRTIHADNTFEIGVMFLDEQTRFRIRMVEQVCHIMQFQQQQIEAGRALSFEDAATEWMDANAADFGRC